MTLVGPKSEARSPKSSVPRLLWSGRIVFILVIAGCAVGPNYKRPQTGIPEVFRGQTNGNTNTLAELPWWRVFQDDALQGLIRGALTNNYDLRIAVTRVEQARAMAEEARAGFFPQVNYQASAGRGKNAANGFPTVNGKTADIFSAAGTASWEIDLWGRIRRLNESARAQFLATREAQRNVRISIISQTAQEYFQLLALDAQLEIAKEATNAFGESLKIFSERLEHGVASQLETSAAEAAQASAAAQIPDLERRIALQENAINVLLGKYIGPVPRNDSALEKFFVPDVPVGLPSTLLERRPDIREAEQQLRSANAQVGVAVADYFPQLNLTGLFGRVSPELSAFTAGGANAWSVAANLAGPIFQGGRLNAQYRQAKAARAQYWLQYQAAVLNGFREVSDALISRQLLAESRVAQETEVGAYREAVQVVMERYRVGQSSYYEVLQEQQQLFPAEDALVQTGLNQLLNTVQLYQALGGGWEMKKE
ncbi:MAG TPA: efflux transporter outer membrane subunit [Verrucomicrobiae bacterium]|jgi:multidrug efflux system outer membrane protein